MPFIFIIGALTFFVIALVINIKNKEFKGAIRCEGIIRSIRQARSRDSTAYYPTIEYKQRHQIISFESDLSVTSDAKIGQRIDIEISKSGQARIQSRYHQFIVYLMFSLSAITILFSYLFTPL